jgi:hypothetical protein
MSDDFAVAPAADSTRCVEIDSGDSSGDSQPLAHQGIPDILAPGRHPTIVPHAANGGGRGLGLAVRRGRAGVSAMTVPVASADE